jgi:hypothetical protein
VFPVTAIDTSVLSFIADPPATPGNPHSGVSYASIKGLPDITGISGVRADKATADSVVITASTQLPDGETVASIYQGNLQALPNAPASRWHILRPQFTGENVTKSVFYGPNTSLFDPTLGAGNIRAVGSYRYEGSETDHGMIYQGPLDGSGSWTQIDAMPLVPVDHTLQNTIPHSTMGTLVVGNYDLDSNTSPGHAFIYNMTDQSWTDIGLPLQPEPLSTTAYGIWQNDSTHYTIAGGFSDVDNGGINEGYVVDYDAATKTFSDLAIYNFNNMPVRSLVSHFDGITGTANGYNLTGEYVDLDHGDRIGGFFASITREADGSFSQADWTNIIFPNASLTTGDTVIGNNVLGIYAPRGDLSAVSSFIATVPQS